MGFSAEMMQAVGHSAVLAVTVVPTPGSGGWAVPNPGPADPTIGTNAIPLVLSYVKWGVIMVCAVAGVAAGGRIAVASMTDRPDHGVRGRLAIFSVLGGLVVGAIAIPVVNTVFSAVS